MFEVKGGDEMTQSNGNGNSEFNPAKVFKHHNDELWEDVDPETGETIEYTNPYNVREELGLDEELDTETPN
jgi:hypothetical protein